MKQPDYFLIKLRADDSVDVKGRWTTQSEWIALQAQIRAALGSGGELPDNLPMLEAEFGDGLIKLVDLRGIDLSNLTIGKADLSYCCFDHANFFGTRFDATCLQYSSMHYACLNSSNWNQVQASPISACRASFSHAHINSSFFMRSNLDNAKFLGATITNTAIVGSMLGFARLSAAAHLFNVDITDLKVNSYSEFLGFRSNPGVVGVARTVEKDAWPVFGVRKVTPRSREKVFMQDTLLSPKAFEARLADALTKVQEAKTATVEKSNLGVVVKILGESGYRSNFRKILESVYVIETPEIVERNEAKQLESRVVLPKKRNIPKRRLSHRIPDKQ